MVEIVDFNLVNNFALENELPFYITGFTRETCESYIPPPGYIIVSCDYAGSVLVGGSILGGGGMSKIRLGKEDVVNTRTLLMVGGLALIAVVGIGAVVMRGRGKRK